MKKSSLTDEDRAKILLENGNLGKNPLWIELPRKTGFNNQSIKHDNPFVRRCRRNCWCHKILHYFYELLFGGTEDLILKNQHFKQLRKCSLYWYGVL